MAWQQVGAGWSRYVPSDGWAQLAARKAKPKKKKKTIARTVGSGRTTTTITGGGPVSDPGYQGLSDSDLDARAHALAAAQIAASRSSIERARAAAMAQAQRDAGTYQALGTAQMGMIGQIPANIQGIRNNAGAAIAAYGNQIAGGQADVLTGEQAANAAFSAGQGVTPTGPGPAGAPPSGTPGIDAQAAMAASAQMGGVLPARREAEIGAASAMAAEGMPAVVARATQDQVAMRMAQAATEDADYRQQLIDLAATEGGAYQDALSSLYDVESKKFGTYEAQQRLKMDQQQFEYKQMTDQRDYELQVQAELASEVAAGVKTKLQAQKDLRNWRLAQQRVKISQQNADTSASKLTQPDPSLSKAYGFIVDGNGQPVLDASGKQIPYSTKTTTKAAKGGPAKAASMAAQLRGTVWRTTDKTQEKLPPKVGYRAAYNQIHTAMLDAGYKDPQAAKIARQAVNSHYGPGFRPKEFRGG